MLVPNATRSSCPQGTPTAGSVYRSGNREPMLVTSLSRLRRRNPSTPRACLKASRRSRSRASSSLLLRIYIPSISSRWKGRAKREGMTAGSVRHRCWSKRASMHCVYAVCRMRTVCLFTSCGKTRRCWIACAHQSAVLATFWGSEAVECRYAPVGILHCAASSESGLVEYLPYRSLGML